MNHSTFLETRRIRLREVHGNDLATIFKWRNTEKFRLLFHYDESEVTYDQFCEEFTLDAHARKFQFVIENKKTSELVGLTFIHSYSDEFKTCFLNLFITEAFERKGYGTSAFVLFTLFLFNQVGLTRLFAQASDDNEHSIACLRKVGMRELVGNIEKKIRSGKEHNILCFAADQNIIPRFTTIYEFMTAPNT